jgi:predicted dinucleotide-binding enzyme
MPSSRRKERSVSSQVRVGIVGSGRIGGNLGLQLARRGHEVLFSFSRDEGKLRRLADEAGEGAGVGTPREAAQFGEAVIVAVPWAAIDDALERMGPLEGRVVVDTTNQFGAGGIEPVDGSAAAHNAARMPDALVAKAFNTLTADYQRSVGDGEVGGEIAMFFATEDKRAGALTSRLIADCNFEPVDIGGWAQVALMEAPRRDGAVYGEAYRPDAARAIAVAAREDLQRASQLATELRLP